MKDSPMSALLSPLNDSCLVSRDSSAVSSRWRTFYSLAELLICTNYLLCPLMLHVWLNRLFAHGKGRSIVRLYVISLEPPSCSFLRPVSKSHWFFFFKRIESLDRWVLHSHIKIHSCYLSEVTASKINHTWTGQGSAGKNISPSSLKPEWLLKLHLELSICCQIFRWAMGQL